MIIINTLEDIEKAEITPKELKEEILQHFQEIAESVVDKYWKMYNLKEIQHIIPREMADNPILQKQVFHLQSDLRKIQERGVPLYKS